MKLTKEDIEASVRRRKNKPSIIDINRDIINAARENRRPYVRCPKCGRGDVEYRNGYWECLWRDCMHRDENIISTSRAEELIQLAENLRLLKKYGLLREDMRVPYISPQLKGGTKKR